MSYEERLSFYTRIAQEGQQQAPQPIQPTRMSGVLRAEREAPRVPYSRVKTESPAITPTTMAAAWEDHLDRAQALAESAQRSWTDEQAVEALRLRERGRELRRALDADRDSFSRETYEAGVGALNLVDSYLSAMSAPEAGGTIYRQREQERQTAGRDVRGALLGILGRAAQQAQTTATGAYLPTQEQQRRVEETVDYAALLRDARQREKAAIKPVEWPGRQEAVEEYARLQQAVLTAERRLERGDAAVDTEQYLRDKQAMEALRSRIQARDKTVGSGARPLTVTDRLDRLAGAGAGRISGSAIGAGAMLAEAAGRAGTIQALSSPEYFMTAQMLGLDPTAERQRVLEAVQSEQARAGYERVYDFAQGISEQAARDLQQAKEGLGTFGRAGVDIGENLIEMGFDAGIGALTGGGSLASMFVRVLGSSGLEARERGASFEQMFAYGLTNAAIEVLTEKLADGVAGIYGKGAADEITEAVIGRLAETDTGRTLLRVLSGAISEGAEEVLSDLLSPLAERIINDEAFADGYLTTVDPADTLYSFLIGAAVGLIGGGTSILTGQNAEANAALRERTERASRIGSQVNEAMAALQGRAAAGQGLRLDSWGENGGSAQNTRAGEDSTAVNTDPAEHSAAEQAVVDAYQAAVDEEFADYVRGIRDNGTQGESVFVMKPVSARAAEDIHRLTGVEVTGNRVVIEPRMVAHILREHGENGRSDHSMADANDIARMQFVLENYDRVENGGTSSAYVSVKPNGRHAQAQTVVFSKKVNGTYYVVEAVPDTRKKTIFIVSAYMGIKKAAPSSVDARASRITSETAAAGAAEATVASSAPVVNPNSGSGIVWAGSERAQGGLNNAAQQQSEQRVLGQEEPARAGGEEAGAGAGADAERSAAETERSAGAGVSDGGRGRDAGARAGGKAERLVRSPEELRRRAAEQGRRAAARQGLADDLRRKGVIAYESARELGVRAGSEVQSLLVIPEEHYDTEMRRAADYAMERYGLPVTYVSGMIQLEGGGTARGVYLGDGLLIQADCRNATVSQLVRHECFHREAELDSGLVESVRDEIAASFGERELKRTLQSYLLTLRGSMEADALSDPMRLDESARAVMEELCADAYAGINFFGLYAFEYHNAAERAVQTSRSAREQRQANGERETRGPPEERYSIDEDFTTAFQEWIEKGKPDEERFAVSTTSRALQSIGVDPRRIVWDSSKINRIQRDHPEMSDTVLAQVPELLERPVIVMESRTQPNRLTMFGEVYGDNGLPVMAVLELLPVSRSGHEIHELKLVNSYTLQSESERENRVESIKRTQKKINESHILYIDPNKNRTAGWLSHNQLQLPLGITSYGSIGRVSLVHRDVKGRFTAESNTQDIPEWKKKLLGSARNADDFAPDQRYSLSDETDAEQLRQAMELAEQGAATRRSAQEQRQANSERETRDAPEEQYSVGEGFDNEVKIWFEQTKPHLRAVSPGYFRIGSTSEALRSIGARADTIYMRKYKIGTILEDHPETDVGVIQRIPELLENPILIMKSRTQPDSIVLLGDVRANNGDKVMVALQLTPQPGGSTEAEFSLVTSAYGRTDSNIRNLISNSELMYLDPNKKRTDTWLMQLRVQFPSRQPLYGPIGTIAYADGAVNITGKTLKELGGTIAPEGSSPAQRYSLSDETDAEQLRRALEMAEQGAAPSEIYNETGLTMLGNGSIIDPYTGTVLGRAERGYTGRHQENAPGIEGTRGTQTAVSGDGRQRGDVRSNRSRRRDETQREAWEKLSGAEQRRITELIRDYADQNANDLTDLLREGRDDKEYAREIYKLYQQGDTVLEQEGGLLFNNPDALAEALDAELSAPAQLYSLSDDVGAEELRRALEMAEQGAAPSEIYNETGLTMLGNGTIIDPYTGNVLGRAERGKGTGKRDAIHDAAERRRRADREVSGHDRREISGSDGRAVGAADQRATWNELRGEERQIAEELILSHLEDNTNDLTEAILADTANKTTLARRVYELYQQGDAVLEQEGGLLFNNPDALAEALDAELSAPAQLYSLSDDVGAEELRRQAEESARQHDLQRMAERRKKQIEKAAKEARRKDKRNGPRYDPLTEFAGKDNPVREYAKAAQARAAAARAERLMHVDRESFTGSPALQKLGVKIENSIGNFSMVDQLIARDRAAFQLRRTIRREEKRLNPTPKERQFAAGIAEGIYTAEDIPRTMDRFKVETLSDYYWAERGFAADLIGERRRDINLTLDEQFEQLLMDSDLYQVPKAVVLHYRTPERLCRSIWGDEHGRAVYDAVFRPVSVNEAEKLRFTNRMFDEVRSFEGSDGSRSELNRDERALVQQVLEGRAVAELVASMEMHGAIESAAENINNGSDPADAAREFSLSEEERGIAGEYARWLQTREIYDSGEFDRTKIDNAVSKYAEMYNLLYDAINDHLVAHGYQPIGFIKGYAPHMQMKEDLDLLNGYIESMGFNSEVTQLPASIAGRTADFKPGKRWNPYFLSRTGDLTDYDIAKGFESYIGYLGDILYHTDDVMRVRAMSRYYRRTFAPDEQRERLSQIHHFMNASPEEKEQLLKDHGIISRESRLSGQDIESYLSDWATREYEHVENMIKYSDFVSYLDNYANLLAGKQSMLDRSAETLAGRGALNFGNKMINAFKRSNVAGSLSSALNQCSQLPQIRAELGAKVTARAALDFVSGTLRRAAWAQESDFLTGKRGVNMLVTDAFDMAMNIAFTPASFVDELVSTVAVRGKYLKEIDAGRSHSEAMREADRFGRSVMGSRVKGETPTAFNSKNPIMQMLNVFQVEALNSWEHLSQDLPADFRRIEKAQGKQAAATALAGVLVKMLASAFLLNRLIEEISGGTPAPFDILGLTANFIASGYGLTTNRWLKTVIDNSMERIAGERILGTRRDDMRESFNVRDAVEDTAYNVGNDVPFLRNAMALLGLGDQTLPLPLMGAGKDLSYLWNDLWRDIDEGRLSGDAVKDLLRIGTQLIPGGRQIRKSVEGLQLMREGGRYVNGRLYYPVENEGPGALTNWIQAILFGKTSLAENGEFYAGDSRALSERQTDAYDALAENGSDRTTLYWTMQDYRAVSRNEELGSYERGRQERAVITDADLTDEERLAVYAGMSEDNEGRAEKFAFVMESGLSWAESVRAYDEWAELYADESLSSSERAEAFAAWVERQDYTPEQRKAVRVAFLFYQSIPITQTKVDTFIGAGFDADDAEYLSGLIRALRPLPGKDYVSAQQRYCAIAGSRLSEEAQWDAITALVSPTYTSTRNKITIMRQRGISPTMWTESRQATWDADDAGDNNDSTNQQEAREALDGMDLTREERAVLWQLTNASWRYKNNPYDRTIGQAVYRVWETLRDEEETGLMLED